MRRLTRLTLAFSKKRENFEAAVGLHFAYYNFVKRHNTLRCTPAMAAGVDRYDFGALGIWWRPQREPYRRTQDVIHKLHGAEATHRASVPVKEVFKVRRFGMGLSKSSTCKAIPKQIRPMPGCTIRAILTSQSNTSRCFTFRLLYRHITAVRAFIVQEFRNANPAEA